MDKNRFGKVSNSALKKTILWLAMMSYFLPPFMGSALNIALPALGREFSLSAVAVGWLNSVFFLTTAICLAPFGKIADIYGPKKAFFWGTNLYSVACLLCA